MAKNLFILNDGPYGTERSYNALRLAGARVKREGEDVRVFLMGDAAACACDGQKVPTGYYNRLLQRHGHARRCSAARGRHRCVRDLLDARGLVAEGLVAGAQWRTLEELTTWTQVGRQDAGLLIAAAGGSHRGATVRLLLPSVNRPTSRRWRPAGTAR